MLCKDGRKSPWCVCLIHGGKKSRKFFATEKEARTYLREYRRKLEENGINALFFTPLDKADYMQALTIAREHGHDRVLSFVSALLRAQVAAGGIFSPQNSATKKTLVEAYTEYYEAKEKQGRAKGTLGDIRLRVRRFCEAFNARPFSELTQRDIEEFCVRDDQSPRTCRNNFVSVLSFLRFCKRRGYHNMTLDFDRHAFLPRELKRQKSVFSLQEVRDILDVLQEEPTFRRFIPFFALQLFCGIRRAEAERMRWNYIDFASRSIRLPAEITKTGDEHIMRPPFLPETVFAWLEPFRPLVNSNAPIAAPSIHMRAAIMKRLGKWEHNGMRHTFATMHVSLHGDPAKTAVLLRHRNQQRLWQNYLARLVPEDEARAYFDLRPQNALLAALNRKA